MPDLGPPSPGDQRDTPCPGCGATLSVESTLGARSYGCPACGGVLLGIAPFRQLVGQRLGHQLWVEAMEVEQVTGTGPCSFCGAPMKPAPVENGRVWACKTCEMAFLDEAALTGFRSGGLRVEVATGESVPRCENCGAPLLHSWDTRCTYCLAPIVQQTVANVEGAEGR
jgi:Zn-finger nucleic acid-binding protein